MDNNSDRIYNLKKVKKEVFQIFTRLHSQFIAINITLIILYVNLHELAI